jgi:hypothetical protein
MKSLGIDENDLRDLYTLKLCLDREIFKEKFGSIDNFNKKFNGFFTKQFFELIF